MKRFYESAKIATQYVKYRPKYPAEVADFVLSFCNDKTETKTPPQLGLMVDVGCGSGQSTNVFQPYFKEIIGIDVSLEQLNQAKKQNKFDNIKYMEGSAESIPVEDHSVDLVLAGTAAHWFDLPKFFAEVERVLKPDTGRLAVIGYHAPTLSLLSNEDNLLANKSSEMLKSWVEKCAASQPLILTGVQQCHKRYADIFEAIPFSKKLRNDGHHLRYKSSLFDICRWFSSMDFYESFLEEKLGILRKQNVKITDEIIAKIDPAYQICRDLLNLWNLESHSIHDPIFEVDYNYFILLGNSSHDNYDHTKLRGRKLG